MTGKITYALVSHNLTEARDFWGRVLPTRTVTIEDVVDRIIKQGSTLTRTDILGVLEGFNEAVEDLLLEGARVLTPLVNFGVSMKGIFEHLDSPFDPAVHRLVSRVSSGPRLRETISSRGRPERDMSAIIPPQPTDYFDVASGEWNGTLTPGGLGKVTGHLLKIDPADETQGLTFIAEDGTRTPVTMLGENQPTKLLFLVPPDLAPGSYRLQVEKPAGATNLRHDLDDIVLTV